MAWLRIEDAMVEHEKVIALTDRAFRVHIEAMCYAVRNATDGFVPEPVTRRFAWSRKAPELVEHQLWERTDGGWFIHDFLEYNISRADSEALSAKRAEAGSKGGKSSASKRRESKAEANRQASATASAEANPKPDHDHDSEHEADHDHQERDPDLSPEPMPAGFRPVIEALENAGLQSFQNAWVIEWLRRVPADDFLDAIRVMTENANTASSRYIDRVLEGYARERAAGRQPRYVARSAKTNAVTIPAVAPRDDLAPLASDATFDDYVERLEGKKPADCHPRKVSILRDIWSERAGARAAEAVG